MTVSLNLASFRDTVSPSFENGVEDGLYNFPTNLEGFMVLPLNSASFRDIMTSWVKVDEKHKFFCSNFAAKVLGDQKYPFTPSKEIPKKVCTAVKDLLCQHKNQFTEDDCPVLEKLQRIINQFERLTGLKGRKSRKQTSLDKAIKAIIKISKKPFFQTFPSVILHLIYGYCSIETCINFFILGKISGATLNRLISPVDTTQMDDFVTRLRERITNKHIDYISRQTVEVFYKYTDQTTQELLLNSLLRKNDNCFRHIFNNLPKLTTNLNLNMYKLMKASLREAKAQRKKTPYPSSDRDISE